MNVEIVTEAAQFPRKGTHKWDFRCSVDFCYITNVAALRAPKQSVLLQFWISSFKELLHKRSAGPEVDLTFCSWLLLFKD